MYRKKLLDLGIPAHVKGFQYLNSAIQLDEQTPTMDVYRQVAIAFDSTPPRVERAMRNAIESSGEEISVGAFIAKYRILWEETENGNYN